MTFKTDTVPEIIEATLDLALIEAAHERAYRKKLNGPLHYSPARYLDRSAHYYAAVWHRDAADHRWKMLKYA